MLSRKMFYEYLKLVFKYTTQKWSVFEGVEKNEWREIDQVSRQIQGNLFLSPETNAIFQRYDTQGIYSLHANFLCAFIFF